MAKILYTVKLAHNSSDTSDKHRTKYVVATTVGTAYVKAEKLRKANWSDRIVSIDEYFDSIQNIEIA